MSAMPSSHCNVTSPEISGSFSLKINGASLYLTCHWEWHPQEFALCCSSLTSGLLKVSNLEQIKYLPSFYLTTVRREKWKFINTSHSGINSIFNGTSVPTPQERDSLHGSIFEWQAGRRNLGLVVEKQYGLFCLLLCPFIQCAGERLLGSGFLLHSLFP